LPVPDWAKSVPNGIGMSQIMKTWCGVCATVDPVETLAQLIEDATDLSVAEGLPQALATAAAKEWGITCGRQVAPPPSAKVLQRLDRRGMQWHLA